MNDRVINNRTLRYHDRWDTDDNPTGLTFSAEGDLILQSLPGLDSGSAIQLPGPYNAAISGLAPGPQHSLYCTITEDPGEIVVSLCGCTDQYIIDRPHSAGAQQKVKLPRGLVVIGHAMLVADSGNSVVRILDTDSFQQLGEIKDGLQQPVCLAYDSAGRIYVLDVGVQRVLRFNVCGEADSEFNAALPALAGAGGLAIDNHDVLYVTDTATNVIRCFDDTGAALGPIPAPVTGTFQLRAIAFGSGRLYCADASSGLIWAFDIASRAWIGALTAYRGPVAALAVDGCGALLVKPAADDTVYRFDADAMRVSSGTLLAEALDAGVGQKWERIWHEAEAPANSEVVLDIAVSDDAGTPAGALVWHRSPGPDLIVSSLDGVTGSRYLWLRVTLISHDGLATPRLRQVQAATVAGSYLEYLPEIYRRDDAGSGFLQRWLALFRSELGDWERNLEELPQQFDARGVEVRDLAQLAAWIALRLPSRLQPGDQRQLLLEAQPLYRRRATPSGLRDMARTYVGADIHIFEAYRERRIWQLDGNAQLGVDTALPAASPDGIIVPGYTYADRTLSGLRGDYYNGTNFETLRRSRIDPEVNFNWGRDSPRDYKKPQDPFVPLDQLGADFFSVRWSGQIRPRYSEIYSLRTTSDDGVRLHVGGRRIIDQWNDHAATQDVGQIRLEAGRWYPIVLEYYEKAGVARIELRWSSASQCAEIVPAECLYPIFDECVEVAPERHGGCELLEIGHAIVGEDRPLAADQYGAPLSDDFAHLFTVMVPAAQVPLETQREALRALVEAEKPAHTDFNLCLVEPRMRVGVQSRLGVDSIVGGAGPVMSLDTVELGIESYLGAGQSSPDKCQWTGAH